MSFAEIKKLKEFIKILQESGEVSLKTRMEVGKAIAALHKERTVPKVQNPRAYNINLHRGGYQAIEQISPGGEYQSLGQTTKELLLPKLTYRMKLEESYASSLRKGDKLGAKAIERSIEKVDDEIYKLGATAWIDRKGIPETWQDSLRAYKQPERIEQTSGPFFTGSPIKESLGSTILSKETNLDKLLVKKGTLPKSWFDEREVLRQEIEFINNYLINPEMAQGYAQQAATPYFFKYWSEKGGIAGIKEYLQALKNKARSEGVDFAETKFGELSTIKDVKKTQFSFATVRGTVTDIWQPGSPKQSQVGLIQDATGEKIKFTLWKNQPGFPTLELGKTYVFGNVPVSEYRGSWGLTANKDSVVREIEPMAFTTVSPRPLIGAKTELHDYSYSGAKLDISKPYSIYPVKGTITYTTKSGKVMETPIPSVLGEAGTQKVVVSRDTVRLYRAEPTINVNAPLPDWLKAQPGYMASKDASGRWFSQFRVEAEHYIEHQFSGERPKLTYVDVPKDVFESSLVSNLPEGHPAKRFSARPDKEVFLPKEWAERRQPIEEAPVLPKRKVPEQSPYYKWSAQQERDLFNPYAAFVPLPFAAPLMLNTSVVPEDTEKDLLNFRQEDKRLAVQQAMKHNEEQFKAMFAVPVELGGKWLQKGQEAYASLEARQTEYAADPTKQGLRNPFTVFFEDLPYLAMGALDVMGGALYPLNYPMQAAWGHKAGIGAMEGIRQEITPAEVLGIEDPWQALAANIGGDPLNLLVVGTLAKSQKLAKVAETLGASKTGLKAFAADEAGEIGKSTKSYVKRAKKQAETEQFAATHAPPEGEWSVDELMDDYDSKVLERLSKKDYNLLSPAEKRELDREIHKHVFKDVGEVPEQVPLTQEDWLGIDRYNIEVQRRMKAKLYNQEPVVTIDKKPVAPISEAEKERSLRELEEFRKSLAVPMEEPVPTKVVTSFPKKEAPVISTAVGTDEIEAMTREVIARRESRGEATTPEDIKRIRESILNNAKDSIEYQVRKADEKRFPWGTLALGTGVGTAVTASLFSLPPEEHEAGREQVREALKPSEEQGILGTFVDVVSMDSYLEGAAIMNARALLTGDTRRFGWEDRITPSIAMGIQDRDTDFFSWRGLAGIALDIAVAPTTYLSFGSGAAVKIGSVGGKGAKALKLSKTGVKELATFTKKYGEEMGTLEFAHHIEQNPVFQKKVLAGSGVNLRGWGREMNLIPGSTFDPITNAAREGTMRFSLEYPTGFKKAVGVQEYLENKFVVRAAIKRLPRSSRLLPMEADYAEKAMLLPKKVRFDIAQGTERDIKLAKEARRVFGENYEEIVSNLIEAPVTRESAKLTREQRAIIEELEAFNKGFAAQEMELGLLGTEMSGYLRHTLTPEAKEYLKKGGKKVSTELYTPLSVKNKFTTERTIQGSVSEINERARKELGVVFDYFEANPFKATSIRRAESVQAVEQAKFLKWTVEKYGVSEDVARAAPDEYVQSSVDYIKGAWLPKPIVEDIEKEFVQREAGAALQLYDKALTAWKYGATVTHPAYHASNVVGGFFNNWLAEIDPRSYYRSSRLLLGGDKDKVFTTALGDQYTGEQLMKMAGESGILSQPGMMDIQKLSYEIADTQKEKAIELAKKGVNTPITTAQYEENFIRFSLFNDRIMKGDTIQGARSWVSEFQFQYSKESFTLFERDYMKRAVPFYAWMRGNVPLMGKQLVKSPGKFAQFGKVTDAAVGGQELPQWAEGDLAAVFPWDESTGTFNYMRTPATDLDAYSDPLWYGFSALTPFAKYPLEKGFGFNAYTGKDFDSGLLWYDPQSSAESNLIMGRTGRDIGTLSDVYEDKNAGKQGVRYLTGVGQARTETKKRSDKEIKDIYKKATGRPNDFSYEQRLQLMQRDNWASAQSGISGEFEQLQGGHVYPAELGGAAMSWNYITQTREENLEWLSAQNYIENLPEREIQQEEAWGRVAQEYSAGVEEINSRTLDTRGRPENEAQKEKKRYDLRKSANIKMYNRQLNTVRTAIRSAEKDLRGEKKKVEDAKGKGYSDLASEAQIKVIEAALAEYRVLYDKVSGLRDAEQGKEFELPVQGTDLSRFQPMDIGGYDKYAVRYGRGEELAKPEGIEKLVDLKKITAYYAAMKSYGPVAGFMPGTPEEVKNRILITRDARYEELAQIANPLITGAGWEGISGKNYIGPRNISELRDVVEGSMSEPEPLMGMEEPPAWYSDQQISQEPRQAMEFDYNDPEFREVVREIVQETLSEGIATD